MLYITFTKAQRWKRVTISLWFAAAILMMLQRSARSAPVPDVRETNTPESTRTRMARSEELRKLCDPFVQRAAALLQEPADRTGSEIHMVMDDESAVSGATSVAARLIASASVNPKTKSMQLTVTDFPQGSYSGTSYTFDLDKRSAPPLVRSGISRQMLIHLGAEVSAGPVGNRLGLASIRKRPADYGQTYKEVVADLVQIRTTYESEIALAEQMLESGGGNKSIPGGSVAIVFGSLKAPHVQLQMSVATSQNMSRWSIKQSNKRGETSLIRGTKGPTGDINLTEITIIGKQQSVRYAASQHQTIIDNYDRRSRKTSTVLYSSGLDERTGTLGLHNIDDVFVMRHGVRANNAYGDSSGFVAVSKQIPQLRQLEYYVNIPKAHTGPLTRTSAESRT